MPDQQINKIWEVSLTTGFMESSVNNSIEEGYLVIVVAGQSNARGNGSIRSGIDDNYTGLSHVFQWDSISDSIIPATNPLKHQDTYTSSGLWMEFVRALPTNRNILIVPVAKGASGFGIHWNPGQSVYNEAVSRIQNALTTDISNTLGAVLWHQGETDATNNNTNYLTDITTMRSAMISVIPKLTDDTPFIVGSIKPNGTNERIMINTALNTFASNIPAVKYVDLTDLPTAVDNTHFIAESLDIMGQRYYDAYNTNRSLLKIEDFKTDTVVNKPWIVLQSGDQNYAATIVDISGTKYLRSNLNSEDTNPDPITNKLRNGLWTHTFVAANFYSSVSGKNITFEQDFYFDDCWWKSSVNDPYPIVAGKLFLSDTTVDSNACYLSLTNQNIVTITSSNDSSGTWAQPQNGGWCSRDYGWKNGSGTSVNQIYFGAVGKPLFKSDNVVRTLTFEIQYNPGGIGYHKGRLKANGLILHDSTNSNTDINGWFNLPIEYKFKGTRIYTSVVDINDPEDSINTPGSYQGIACGYNIKRYAVYDGIQGI